MNIEDLEEYKQRAIIAKKQGDVATYEKYYNLMKEAYKEITGESFDDAMKRKIAEENKKEEIEDLEK